MLWLNVIDAVIMIMLVVIMWLNRRKIKTQMLFSESEIEL